MNFKDELISERLPEHVAIIMDGNGRWAKKKGYVRALGHENGVDALRNIATAAAEVGVRYLTVYAFSSENWNRPRKEVNALMSLLVSSLKKELKTLTKNEISLNAIGDLGSLPDKCQLELTEVIRKTGHNSRMVLTLALSYGSKDEILETTRTLAAKVAGGELKPDEITEELFQKHLYTGNLPNPDLLIRTSGEWRISNFLLWQIAYAELYFTEKLWPEFGKEDFYQALYSYQQRERRFGKISEQLKS